jgi:cephalosporin-C deacetylase-like acetyl esterase
MVVCPEAATVGWQAMKERIMPFGLMNRGIAAFVLKYRLGSAGYRHPVMLQDAARAVRTVRANAAAWKIDPKRIGIIGSSAGGAPGLHAGDAFRCGHSRRGRPYRARELAP